MRSNSEPGAMSIPEPTLVDGAQNLAEEVVPVFPPDLEKKIFLLTARTYRDVSTRLMLVASRVKTWIEPLVYKTVILGGPGNAVQFLDALRNDRPPDFAQSHVKALCIRPSIPLRVAIQLLTTCSGLESLALWIRIHPQSDTADLINLLSSLPLTSLSLITVSNHPTGCRHPGVQQNHHVFVNLTRLKNLTHLDIADHRMLWTSTDGIEHLPLLTHLAFRFWSHDVNAAFSTILRESPKLEVLILLDGSNVISESRECLEEQGIRDIRVVVLRHARDTEWESMVRGSVTMWDRADMIVSWRRRNRAGPFDFPPGFSFGSIEAPRDPATVMLVESTA